MRGGVGYFTLLLAALCVPASAGAMSAPGKSAHLCRVIGGEKWLAGAGGPDALCGEIRRAMAAAIPGQAYDVQVRLLSPSRAAATLTVNGHALSGQHFAIMDSDFTGPSLREFAQSLANAAKAGGRRV
jgi:hypothetical protein